MRRLGLLALLLALLPVAAASARSVPVGFFGMMANGPLDDPVVDLNAEAGMMRGAGVQSWRVALDWDRIQPEQHGPLDWVEIDRKVGAAAANGMSVLGLVLGSPDWASAKPGIPLSPPSDPETYAQFMRLAIARYGPFGQFWAEHPEVPGIPIRAWQVWNEPNLSGYFSVRPYPKPYVRLLGTADDAIHDADPGATVVMAGLANFSWKAMRRLYKAGIKGTFDVAAVHPFSGFPRNSVKIAELNRRVLDAHGDARTPMWLTELTWTSAKGKTENVHNWETTERGQARRLKRGYALYVRARRRLRLQRIYWYTWAGSDRPPNSFEYSGLRHYNGDGTFADKPAMSAFREVTARYGG